MGPLVVPLHHRHCPRCFRGSLEALDERPHRVGARRDEVAGQDQHQWVGSQLERVDRGREGPLAGRGVRHRPEPQRGQPEEVTSEGDDLARARRLEGVGHPAGHRRSAHAEQGLVATHAAAPTAAQDHTGELHD